PSRRSSDLALANRVSQGGAAAQVQSYAECNETPQNDPAIPVWRSALFRVARASRTRRGRATPQKRVALTRIQAMGYLPACLDTLACVKRCPASGRNRAQTRIPFRWLPSAKNFLCSLSSTRGPVSETSPAKAR